MSKFLPVIVTCVICVLATECVQGAPLLGGYRGSFSLRNTHSSDAASEDFDLALELNGSADIAHSQFNERTVGPVTYSATFSYDASAIVRVENHEIGVHLAGTAGFVGGGLALSPVATPPLVSATASITYEDRISLVYRSTGEIPDIVNQGLDLNFILEGELSAGFTGQVPYGSSKWDTFASISFHVQNEALSFRIGENAVFGEQLNGTRISFLPGITARSDLSHSLSTDVRASLVLSAQTTMGAFNLDLFDTMKFDSVTFADGLTPESHGFDVILASGLPSPNLQQASSVPEPTSLALLAMGAFGLCGYRLRNRTQQSANPD